jgi:PAS domain S-box-containing protein
VQPKHLILFLADGGNNLQLMAEAYARSMNNDDIDLISATMAPPKLSPIAERVMLENGIDISGLSLLTPLDIEPFTFDLIITLGSIDQNCRPNLPGMPPHLHWDVPDPKPGSPEAVLLRELRKARDELKEKVETLFDSELLHALFVTRGNLELILDNLLDGVMAHTTNRRIFFFNQAAEKITGYRREAILGKDCHDVFSGRFCGGDCQFCEGPNKHDDRTVIKKEIVFTRPDGKERILRMSIVPLSDADGNGLGALLSFIDDTELSLLKRRLKHHHSLGGLVGKDPKMLELFKHIREVSSENVPVLIEGESGTGKELVAKAIHDISPRAEEPFVAINCGALPEGILESELFGHVRGAFSGAVQDRKGRFELADKGTIFLDEVSELSPAMQVKLLRVLQEQRFEPVGGERTIQVNVRVVSATNQNLRHLMERKQFRRDLFYRLCVIPITLPPLRERRLDIPMLVEHFLELTAQELERPVLSPSNEVLDLFTRYPWPGNVRELRNAIEYAYVKCRSGVIAADHLPPEIAYHGSERRTSKPGPALKLKKEEILAALAEADGNKKQAAKVLRVGRATIYRYLEHYGLK